MDLWYLMCTIPHVDYSWGLPRPLPASQGNKSGPSGISFPSGLPQGVTENCCRCHTKQGPFSDRGCFGRWLRCRRGIAHTVHLLGRALGTMRHSGIARN